MITREFHAMGCQMHALLDSSGARAEAVMELVPLWFEEWEAIFSRFRPESELSRLNRSGGRPTQVSNAMWEVFQASLEAEAFTGGLVCPTVLDAVLQSGYDRSFDLMPSSSGSGALAVQELPMLALDIITDPVARTLQLPDGVHLDLGGLVKGWAAQKALSRLQEFGPALVDAGGDIAIRNPGKGGKPWAVGVRDPFQPETTFVTLRMESGGIATSGTDYHRWQYDGRWVHHIIDPLSGLPAETDLYTVTILAPRALQAEAAAKAVLIAGSEAGLAWLENETDLAGILIAQYGEVIYSSRMPAFLWR